MFRFFKKNKIVEPEPAPAPKPARAPSEGISYDENLISTFEAEHQALLRLFVEIKEAAESNNFPIVKERLKKFTSILRGHLLTENVKLYVYLSRELAHDVENKEIIMAFRREMMQIGKAVNQFVTLYDKPIWSREMETTFLPELLAIGEVLVQRIEREESTLYPLYMPEAHYKI